MTRPMPQSCLKASGQLADLLSGIWLRGLVEEDPRESHADKHMKHSTPKSDAREKNGPNGEIIYELFAVHLKIPPVKLCLATWTALKSMEWQ